MESKIKLRNILLLKNIHCEYFSGFSYTNFIYMYVYTTNTVPLVFQRTFNDLFKLCSFDIV